MSDELDFAVIEKCKAQHERIIKEVSNVIVGQSQVVDEVLMALFCNSHILLVGVPGLAKTLLISTLADVLHLKYKRVQFTPDLLPGDITGSEVIEEDKATGRREFRFIEGPVFTNLLLADEINRTPPKTQSALLQAMQEREVSIGTDTKKLDAPFLVMATQNPLEQEGTYPLPEAQLDRFMFNTFVDYPTDAELVEIVERTTGGGLGTVKAIMSAEEILEVQKVVRRIPIARPVVEYLVNLSAITRPGHPGAPDYVRNYLSWGCGPRAAQYLALGAKAHAVLHGQPHASIEGVRAVAHSVLRHRIALNFNGKAEGFDTMAIVDKLLETTQVTV
ncbi:MAG: MoxR-like ATPase [Rhodothermales bacterium]|jgi:MoxR-like ATPase